MNLQTTHNRHEWAGGKIDILIPFLFSQRYVCPWWVFCVFRKVSVDKQIYTYSCNCYLRNKFSIIFVVQSIVYRKWKHSQNSAAQRNNNKKRGQTINDCRRIQECESCESTVANVRSRLSAQEFWQCSGICSQPLTEKTRICVRSDVLWR